MNLFRSVKKAYFFFLIRFICLYFYLKQICFEMNNTTQNYKG